MRYFTLSRWHGFGSYLDCAACYHAVRTRVLPILCPMSEMNIWSRGRVCPALLLNTTAMFPHSQNRQGIVILFVPPFGQGPV